MSPDNRQHIIKCWFDEITRLIDNKEFDKIKEISANASEYIDKHFNDPIYWPIGEA